jgi:hypothetical protein
MISTVLLFLILGTVALSFVVSYAIALNDWRKSR